MWCIRGMINRNHRMCTCIGVTYLCAIAMRTNQVARGFVHVWLYPRGREEKRGERGGRSLRQLLLCCSVTRVLEHTLPLIIQCNWHHAPFNHKWFSLPERESSHPYLQSDYDIMKKWSDWLRLVVDKPDQWHHCCIPPPGLLAMLRRK